MHMKDMNRHPAQPANRLGIHDLLSALLPLARITPGGIVQ